MRRKDREVTDFEEIIKIMEQCDVCRLALHDGDYPYILPLNFGMQVEDGQIALYFHGALEGKKYELMKRDNRAGFEMDCDHVLLPGEGCNCAMTYQSVIGTGLLEILPEEEKEQALIILMKHYHKKDFSFNKAGMSKTTVFKLTVNYLTAKRYRKY